MAHAGGRPLKFQSVEQLEFDIDRYFENTPPEEVSITGLAIHLDTFRDVLCDYQEKDEFSNTIKKAKQRVENAYEKRLIKQGRSGDIFALKNFGWKDKIEVDQHIDGTLNTDTSVDEMALKLNALEKDGIFKGTSISSNGVVADSVGEEVSDKN